MVSLTAISTLAIGGSVAAQQNIARVGTPIIGAGVDLLGTNDVTVDHFGPISEVNDGVFNTNPGPNSFQIDANGQIAANGNGVDTFAGGITGNAFDFVGVLFDAPQFGVTSVRVQNFIANDGGWWGPTNVVAGGSPLTAGDLTPPEVQITFDGGDTWSSVTGAASNYVSQYAGAVRGTGFPNATSGPFADFTFAEQNGINGIRLIGNGAGPADDNGFIGVNEFEAIGIPQSLTLEVNTTTGVTRLLNDVQSSISLDFYEIASASSSLNVAGWDSLENAAGNPAGFPSGDGTGNGWEELGNFDSSVVAEAFLLGSSTLAPEASASLGALFAGGAEDLQLRYRTTSGHFVAVPATYVSGLPGDFDEDIDVDGGDFLFWQRDFGGVYDAGDLADWKQNFGLATTGRMASVPEPAAITLWSVAAAHTAVSAVRRRPNLRRR